MVARVRAVLVLAVLLAVLPSAAVAEGAARRCGPGLHAGKHTSCALAKRLFRKIGRDVEKIGDGRRVPVRSPVTGKTFRFYLHRADNRSFTCRARGDGGTMLSVRIAT